MLVVPVWRYYELLPALSHLIHGTITFPARLCVALPFVMDQEEAVGCLEEMARKRKERLEALKKSASSAPDGDGTSEDSSLPAPVFRNYNPSDESLKELKKPKKIPTPVEEIFDEMPSEKTSLSEEVDLANLSKKVDWDLKRIIEKPLAKLERRTQRAIAELIRERIAGELREDSAASLSTK